MTEREQDEFFSLMVAFQQGDLTETELEDLERALTEEPERQRLFIDFQRRSTAIAEDFHRQQMAQLVAGNEAQPIARPPDGSDRLVSRSVAGGLLAVAATLLLGFVYVSRPQGEPMVDRSSIASDATFAKLTYTSDASWDAATHVDPIFGGKLKQEVTYHLNSGSARLQMDSGAIVAVAAPASFRGRDQGTIELLRGKIAARMPDTASDLTVQVGSTAIRDLGTAFGITAGGDGEFDLSVFDGSVSVQRLDSSGEMREMRLGEGSTVVANRDAIDDINAPFNGMNYRDIWPLTIGVNDSSSIIEFARPGPRQPLYELANNSRLLLIPEQLNKRIEKRFVTRLLLPGASWPEANTTETVLELGQVVSSYLLAYIPEASTTVVRPTISGSVSFQKRILGVAIEGGPLKRSDEIMGIAEIDYDAMMWRRLEVDWTDDGRVPPDALDISNDGRTLHFDLHVNVVGIDSIRVLVDGSLSE